jgi:glycosyltransferase involved in cell wall biosynthesis
MTDTPLVSVCVPNLNTRPYLQERVDTILAQTYTNWEMVVSDNYSDDGSWEFFQEVARKDSRVSIAQAPRRGLYPNWNNCLERARGRYVYIATSDDTMAPDCLEKLVAALEENEDCDLAHCRLIMIDSAGRPLTDPEACWPRTTLFEDGHEGLQYLRHVRRAPYDGLLHLTGRMVYHSITELLIRRTLFAKIGAFEGRWGSIGDFNWDMKAGLVANTVHVPDTWASFRVHATQATGSVDVFAGHYDRHIQEMIRDAVATCQPFLTADVMRDLEERWLDRAQHMRTYYRQLRDRRDPLQRRLFQASQLVDGRNAARSEVLGRLVGRPRWTTRTPADVRRWVKAMGIDPVQLLPSERVRAAHEFEMPDKSLRSE